MSGTASDLADAPTVLRFRRHRGWPVAGIIFLISLLTLVAVSEWFSLLMLPPLVWTIWAWRAGTDADRGGVVVRALLGTRRLAWSQVESLSSDQYGRVVARRRDGGTLVLSAVTATDLPALSRLLVTTSPPPAR